MKRCLSPRRVAWVVFVAGLVLATCAALARPGGGSSFSGGGGGSSGSGGSSGGGGGGGGGDFLVELFLELLLDVIWALLVAAFEHPAVGVPSLGGVVLLVVLVSYFRGGWSGFATWLIAAFVCFSVTAFFTVPGLLLTVAAIVVAYRRLNAPAPAGWVAESEPVVAPVAPARALSPAEARARVESIRTFDPDFSVVLFEDFLYALYAAVHRARGAQRLDAMAAYLTEPARKRLRKKQVAGVADVIVGAMRFVDAQGLDEGDDAVRVVVEFEGNFTQTELDGRCEGLYVVERWTLSRQRGARSKPPETASVLGCPACGADLDTNLDRVCAYCKQIVEPGALDWRVDGVEVLRRESRGPVLTANVAEEGTDLPTVVDPGLDAGMAALAARDPSFDRAAFHRRVEMIFGELQVAWTERSWERARPFVSDGLFQSQRYWIEAYTRAKLRNRTDGARVTAIDDARVTTDRWYDAITVRVHATGRDYTESDDGALVSGDRDRDRAYTEYWTLIRGAGVRGAARAERVCPKCGAALKINMAGACEYCRAKVTAGEFDWVLSRIEQDEARQG